MSKKVEARRGNGQMKFTALLIIASIWINAAIQVYAAQWHPTIYLDGYNTVCCYCYHLD